MSESPQMGGIFGISDILQSLGNRGWSGTVEVTVGDSEKKVYIFFENGSIQHARPTADRAVLGLILYKLKKLDLADLNFVLTAQERTQKNFGETCLEFGLVTQEDIRQALLYRGREEILALFLETSKTDAQFHQGEEPKEGAFDPEDRKVRLNLNAMGLLMEAARRQDEWSMVKEHVDSLEEVFRRVDIGRPVPIELRPTLLLCDGYRTVEEVARYSPYETFDAYGVIRDLYRDGYLEAVSPMELARAAFEAENVNDAVKALRLFELAEARGLDRVEISKRIALAHQHLGHTQQAIRRWLVYADKCRDQNSSDQALEGYRSAINLDAGQVEAYERLVELLVTLGRSVEACDELRRLIQHLEETGQTSSLVGAYQRYVGLNPRDAEALEKLAEAHASVGATLEALEVFEQLAQVHKSSDAADTAIRVYRRMLEIDEECLHGRLALARTLSELGRPKESVAEYKALAAILERSGIGEGSVNWSFLIKVYESMVELDPALDDAWSWLARTYEGEGKDDLAVSRYMGLVQSLRHQGGREAEMAPPLQRVVKLAPERVDVRKQLARLHLHLDEPGKAVRTWFDLAGYAHSQGNADLEREAYRDIQEVEPTNLKALAGLAKLDERAGRREVAGRRWSLIGGIAVRARQFEQAESALRRAIEMGDASHETYRDYAVAKEGLMHEDEAAGAWARYAGQMLQQENYGLAREAIQKLQSLAPDDGRLEELQQRLGARAQRT